MNKEAPMIKRTLAVMAVIALALTGSASAHEGPHKTHKMLGIR